MSYAAHTADDRPRGPWCAQSHRYGPPWHPGMIVLTILGFVLWWPLGLAMLFFILWSKGMLCWGHGSAHWQHKMERMQEKVDRMRGKMERAWGPASSGNRAFDDYRAETLRRLEEEEKEFREFLTRLRAAKDKAEFDQFMADRRNQSGTGPAPEPTPG
jgi:Protein of unknown function (DUF2852)